MQNMRHWICIRTNKGEEEKRQMMTKTAYYMQMAQEAAAQITGSKEQWTAFLTTSARLYKYPFAEQLMIYKQRPEATA